jgi:hypothetical protein
VQTDTADISNPILMNIDIPVRPSTPSAYSSTIMSLSDTSSHEPGNNNEMVPIVNDYRLAHVGIDQAEPDGQITNVLTGASSLVKVAYSQSEVGTDAGYDIDCGLDRFVSYNDDTADDDSVAVSSVQPQGAKVQETQQFARSRPQKIPYNTMHMVFLAGLRGAVSFACAEIFPDHNGNRYSSVIFQHVLIVLIV